MFKGIGNLSAMLKQAQQVGQRMQKLSEELKARRTTGTAGGEMVEVEVNGLQEVLRCRIHPQLMADGDQELLEDLITAAVNQALNKARQMHADAMKEVTGGLEVPGLADGLAKLLGEGPGA